MVKKITAKGNLEFAEPEEVFNILFGNDEFVKKYHKKINSDPHAEASCWNKNQEREVIYVASVDVPATLQRLAGNSFPVRELQRFEKCDDSYIITSLPKMDSSAGGYFVTEAETVLAPDENGGCAITSNVTLEYRGAWFKGAVETFMEMKARTGFDEWLTLAKLFCQEKLMKSCSPEINDDDECFFDAEEVQSHDALLIAHDSNVANFLSESMENVSHPFKPHSMGTVVESVTDIEQLAKRLLNLEDKVSSTRIMSEEREDLKRFMEHLNSKMMQIEEDAAFVRQTLGRQQDMAFKWRKSVLFSTFLAGFAAGVTVGVMFVRLKKQTRG
ncbi:hypothetical protein KP509_01G107800 [Ceratopteris richardii]|uniref:VASt domain-containing protein n=1 Tax=Ceratopteris richardii TaxID=49495 RepID=A0A8T2VK30_CERRI|nr:hypothetical protein KP509_01G107800 [Ceratopteris richardii]